MRKAVLIGTDLAYDSRGKLVPLEINTNVGWDKVNRKETPEEIFDFTELSTYVREHTIKEICLEGEIAEICKDLIQAAIPDVSVKTITTSDLDEDYPDTTLIVRTAWSPVALVDSFAANKEKFKKLIRNEDFSEDFKLPEGNLPNLVVKAVKPQYDKSEYPKFYKADVATLKVPNGFIVEPAVLNVKNLVEGRIPIFRNWSLFVTDGLNLDSIYLGTYTKVCGEEFDESKLKYDSHGALVQGRNMLVSLDSLATQWPADALLEASDEVLMSDGTWKSAKDLKVGDSVKSLDLGDTNIRHTGDVKISVDEITSFSEATVDFLTRTRGFRDFVEIEFKDGSTWFDTGKSAYMLKSGKQVKFVNIEDLKKGDTVYFLDTETLKLGTRTVKSVANVRKYVDTYNVELSGNHVFFSRGAGETSAFASIEHNDTIDCETDIKSSTNAFQTMITMVGSLEAYTNIPSTGLNVVYSGNSTVIKKFVKQVGNGKTYLNPNEFVEGVDGFPNCWYPLKVATATWNFSIPMSSVTGEQFVAGILRRGFEEGEALGVERGGNVYWSLVQNGTAFTLPVKFTTGDGPCNIYAILRRPSELVTGFSTEDTRSVAATSAQAIEDRVLVQESVGSLGNIRGNIKTNVNWLTVSPTLYDTGDGGALEFDYSVVPEDNPNASERSGKVQVTVKDGAKEVVVVEYTVTQAAKELLYNTISLECNPVMGDEIGSGFAIYDVTASAQYPVSSALSIVANTVDGDHATSMEEDITLTLAQGSSKISGSNLEVSPDGHILYGFGWRSVDFTKPPVIPGTVTATVSPTSDSTYNYQIGNVKVRNFPTLANMPATLYVGTQSSFLVSNEAIPGLEISSSNTAVNVCRLETQANGSVNAVLGNSALAASDPWIYLKRGEQVLCSASIETATYTKPSLTVEPASSTVPVDGGIEIVKLYDENSNLVDADSIDKGVGISEVTRISTGEYRVSVSRKTAGTVSRTVFKKSGYSDATFTVTWQDMIVDDSLKVWFNSGGQETLLSGQDLRLLGNVSTTPGQTSGIFRFSFRYENNKGQAWRPVVASTGGEDMIGVIEGIPGGEGAFTQLTNGEFTVKVTGRANIGGNYTWGILRFETQGTMIIPASSEIITNIGG